MKKLVELDAALEGLENLNAISFYEANEHSKEAYMETRDMLKALPSVDAIPTGVYKQVRWERDIAIQQLDTLGYGLGEKVVPVVRCRDCKHYQFADERAFGFPVKRCEVTGFEDVDDDDFCSRGERKDGEQP